MQRYAEWIEYKRGGKSGRIIKQTIIQRRKIVGENSECFLIEEQEGPIWITKNLVKVVNDENTQVRNNISKNTVDSKC